MVDIDFEAFYARHKSDVVAVCRSFTGSGALAEEVAQEALFTAYRRWGSVEGLDRPDLWVRRVAVNRCISMWRRQGIEERANRLHHAGSADARHDRLPDHELWEAVRQLPKRQAAAIALHYVDQLTTAEIGIVLGCSPSSVQTHLNRGRASLRSLLEPPEAAPSSPIPPPSTPPARQPVASEERS